MNPSPTLSRNMPTTARLAPNQMPALLRWPISKPRIGTMITYNPVMKPELVTVVNSRPTCCRLIPNDSARPMITPPASRLRFSGAAGRCWRRCSKASTGNRTRQARVKRRPV